MVAITSQQWSAFFANPLAIGIVTYFIVGLIVVWIIVGRGMRLRRPLTGGPLWERKDNARNALWLFIVSPDFHPLVLLLKIALWPLWLLFLWAYHDDDDQNHLTNQ